MAAEDVRMKRSSKMPDMKEAERMINYLKKDKPWVDNAMQELGFKFKPAD